MVSGLVLICSVGQWVGGRPLAGSVVGCRLLVGPRRTCQWVGESLVVGLWVGGRSDGGSVGGFWILVGGRWVGKWTVGGSWPVGCRWFCNTSMVGARITSGNLRASISDHLPQFLEAYNIFFNSSYHRSWNYERNWSRFDQEKYVLDYLSINWNNYFVFISHKQWKFL